MSKLADLYHFTCEHGHRGITKTGVLLPNIHPLMRHLGPLLWLTDFADPTPESVGLTSVWQSCDRLAYRYSVRTHAAVPWREIRARVDKEVVADLESFGQPDHWFVVRRLLTASEFALDTSWKREAIRKK